MVSAEKASASNSFLWERMVPIRSRIMLMGMMRSNESSRGGFSHRGHGGERGGVNVF